MRIYNQEIKCKSNNLKLVLHNYTNTIKIQNHDLKNNKLKFKIKSI